jgi:hypothetical protein
MQHSRTAGKAIFTIQVSPTSDFTTPSDIDSSPVTVSPRYGVATYRFNELGFGFFGTADERMHFVRRTTCQRGRGEGRRG